MPRYTSNPSKITKTKGATAPRDRPRDAGPLAPPPAKAESPPPATKLDILVGLLRRPEGASLDQVAAATGWRRHSVRGALAAAVFKRLGAKVISDKTEQGRIYRAPADDR